MNMKKRELKDDRIKVNDPVALKMVTTGEAISTRGQDDKSARPSFYWPKDVPRPTEYVRKLKPLIPCGRCDRIKTDNGDRAVIFGGGVHDPGGKAYGTCRCCGFKFSLPIAKE